MIYFVSLRNKRRFSQFEDGLDLFIYNLNKRRENIWGYRVEKKEENNNKKDNGVV